MPSTDLWTFALACYAQPGVEVACLDLQAQGGDICLLLCGAWLEARGNACTQLRLTQLQQLSGSWQREVVKPLRTLRQAWRDASARDAGLRSLRNRIKALELDAEQTLLSRLEALTHNWEADALPAPWLEPIAAGLSDSHAALALLRRAAKVVQLELGGT